MDKVKEVIVNGFSSGNLTKSQTTGIAIGIGATTFDQYFQILPENIRPYVQFAAMVIFFFLQAKQNP